MCDRVAPILKDAISSGRINLTAIVNTHQYVLPLQMTWIEMDI